MPGHVYLITEEPFEGDKSGPWTKIGFTKNPPEWRMNANLKRGNPRNLIVWEVFIYENEKEARSWERKAHKYFEKYKLQKEWFNLEAREIAQWFLSNGATKRNPKVQ
ncbi:hypothetical protein FGF1_14210 [Flavobacteriaceae bacterium GF1]